VTGHTEKLRAQLSEALEQIPAAFDLLGEFILPGSAPVSPDGPRGASSPSRPPLNLVVLDLQDTREKPDSDPQRTDYDIDRRSHQWRDGRGKMTGSGSARRQGVLPTLASWVRLVDGELWDEGTEHGEPSNAPTVATECTWLLDHADWIVAQQWAVEIADECAAILRDIRAAIGEFEVKDQLACMYCGWDVQEDERGEWFRCSGCDRKWGRVELHKMAERKMPKTLKQCAGLVGVSLSTLRAARNRKEFKPVARDGKAELFDLQAVAVAVQHMKYRDAAS
jgi:hypothetical protein